MEYQRDLEVIMARLPNQKRIMREDLQDAPSWIDRLLFPLNSFMESVYYALNKNITFNENIACQIREITFTTPSTYGVGSPVGVDFDEIRFSNQLRTVPQGVIIMQLNITNSVDTPLYTAQSLHWYHDDGIIYIPYISGLSASTDYTLRVLVI